MGKKLVLSENSAKNINKNYLFNLIIVYFMYKILT